MIGATYTRKSDKHVLRVTGVDPTTNDWVLQDETEFVAPLRVKIEDLRSDFVRAADAPAPATAPDATELGWQRLSAEAKLASLAMLADTSDIVAGDKNPHTGQELTTEQVGRLKRLASRTVGRRAPSPEDVFADLDAGAIRAAADKVWKSDLLGSYEIGQLEVSPSVSAELDRRIKRRNAHE